jgi:hypothetical protein
MSTAIAKAELQEFGRVQLVTNIAQVLSISWVLNRYSRDSSNHNIKMAGGYHGIVVVVTRQL